jgi:two-component system, chemotaxis family, CheB/CheR fusion protein
MKNTVPVDGLPQAPSLPAAFPIVGIGASAGGLEAFREVLRFLPADTGMAYVFVQHLDPTHESLLPALLARVTPMVVREANPQMVVEANHVYVITPNTDLHLMQGRLTLHPETKTRGQHLSIDTFLCSLAEDRTTQAIGVLLSGMASDGTAGLEAIKAHGGITLAQDASSASYSMMPQHAIDTGCVDFIGSPEEIARELLRISRQFSGQPLPKAQTTQTTTPATPSARERALPEQEQALVQMLRLLRQKTGIDFSAYKTTTLTRRMQHRMAALQIESVAAYLIALRDRPDEAHALQQDILIGVTSFFRDPMTCPLLTRAVFPRLLETTSLRAPLRVWVPGCSTGEEVYSLAICWLEFLDTYAEKRPIQLFGTDLNLQAIEYARKGRYSPEAVAALSPARLERFFQLVNGQYQINTSIRECCLFARHNLLRDPPFSHLDLLSCQNVLIYLQPTVQQKLIQIFHYALNPQGVLLLGASETIRTATELFTQEGSHKQPLYRKKTTSTRPAFVGPVSRSRAEADTTPEEEHRMYEEPLHEGALQKEADSLLLDRYAPASLVIDAEMEICHFRGPTGPYLEPMAGKASLNLFKMVRESLRLELRTALHQARKSGSPVKRTGLQMSDQSLVQDVALEVIPLKGRETGRAFLILFTRTDTSTPAATPLQEEPSTERGKRDGKERRLRQLEQELVAKREEMHSMIEEMEATNEELQAANEEILSSNEELQSLNEELETSKEEIQASNEELLVVNQELVQRNTELQRARLYAEAIVETIREPLLILDADLRVQSANRAFYQSFETTPAATEQHQFFALGTGQWDIPALRTLLEEVLPQKHSLMDYEVEHTFPEIGHKIILLNARRIEGDALILLALEDITLRKQMEEEKQMLLEQREDFLGIASHELKTPITTIKGYTQMLQQRFTRAGDEQATTLLNRMNTQLDKLIRLIGELLDLTRMEAGQLPWHNVAFDLNLLVQDTVEAMAYTTEQHQIHIEGMVPLPVVADRERIEQVLLNLLSNAIKYSPHADTVLVHLSVEQGSARISVQDFGIGIDPAKQNQLFERFFRVSDVEHETFPGLGLGLYIAAQIIQRQGGQIWAESQQNAGSTFVFTIPLTLVVVPEQGQKEKHDAEKNTHR